jgi:hypothetical protein
MNFEDFQKSWQHQDAGTQISINADLLLKEVRRNQQQFWATIFWRDVREVGVAILLAAFFLYHGVRSHDWTLYLLAFGCSGVGAFMVADRQIQRRKQLASNNDLKSCLEASLAQVSHQIWLLKNVVWWYLLPIAVPLGISVCRATLATQHSGASIRGLLIYAASCALLFWGIYWLNQFAVRKSLEPRRQELESLLAEIGR